MKIAVEKELLLSVFDTVIAFIEINMLQQHKNHCVRTQDYDGAKLAQQAEQEVAKRIPTIEQLKEMQHRLILVDKPDIKIVPA